MKISLARKNLFHEKTRFAISLGGVAFAVMLIMILLGLYQGWSLKMTRFIDETPAESWVLQNGASDMFHTLSLFSDDAKDGIADINGVQDAHLLLGRQVAFDHNGKDAHLVIMGYDTSTTIGGPPEVIAGRAIPISGEIIIDEVFADDMDLAVNDELVIEDHTYTIVGISTGGNLVMFQYSFMPLQDARDFFQMQDMINYVLINYAEGADRTVVDAAIEEQYPDLQVITATEFADSNNKIITESFLPIIYVLVVISFIVGLTIISLTTYTATIEKSREYGLLKAIGAKPRILYWTVFEQSTYAGIMGYGLGLGLTYSIAWVARQVEPSFLTYFRWEDALFVFGITVIMILISGFIPVKRINRIDPAIVFKA